MTRHTIRRAGFTLIELLVVLSIMALLTAITAGAVFRYKQSSMEKDAGLRIQKLDIGLQQQWKAIVDKAKTEEVPQGVLELTRARGTSPLLPGAYDNARARALHMKLRLQQEMPQTFGEARADVKVMINLSSGQTITIAYPNKQAIIQAIGTTGNDSPENEAAALLYLILTQGRGGSTFDAEGSAPVQVRTINGRQMKIFVDPWDQPIVFRRTVADGEVALGQELNGLPYVTADQIASGNRDPLDPNGRLKMPVTAWHQPANGPSYRDIAKSILSNNTYQVDPFDGTNRGPYIQSAGRNKTYSDDDDLYSFRIQQYGKGN